jgi:hypothetical protein
MANKTPLKLENGVLTEYATADQIPVAHLGTGTPSASNYLRGDGSWQVVSTSLKTKSGVVVAGSFVGNPKKATVTFSTAFASANYSVSLVCQTTANASFVPIIESITASTFVINLGTNNSTNLVDVRWIAVLHGEN